MQLVRSTLVLLVCSMTLRAQNGPAGGESYLLGPGDQVLIRASNAPEINEKLVRIDLNGYFVLPMAGRVHAAGQTVEGLEADLTSRLKVFLEEPEVAVSVSEYQSQPVSVFGEVFTPGVQQLQGRKTLIEVLALAGGTKPDAGPTVRIARQLSYGRIPLPGAKDDATGRYSVAELELKPLIAAQTPDKDIAIQAHDIISVPRAEMVYVAGDVNRSGPLTLTEAKTLSIMEALAASGGVTRTADTRKARIMRLRPGTSSRESVPVDVSSIMRGNGSDVPLVAGDILVIPSSNMKKATLRALEAAIQAGTVILSTSIVSGGF